MQNIIDVQRNDKALKLNISFFIYCFYLVSALLVIVYELIHSGDTYICVSYMTLSYLVCLLVFRFNVLKFNLFSVIVHFFYFIKYVLSPFLIISTGNVNVFHVSMRNFEIATVLLCIEIFVFNFFQFLLMKKMNNSKKTNEIPNGVGNLKLNLVFILFLAYTIFVFVSIPESRDSFKTVFEMGDETFTWDGTYGHAADFTGTTRIMLSLFGVVFSVVRILLPLYLMIFLKKTRIPNIIKIVVSLLLISTQMLFITSTIAEALIDTTILLYFLIGLYDKERKILIAILVLLVFVFIITYLSIRYSLNVGYAQNNTPEEYLCNIVNSYIPNVNSVAACIDINPDSKTVLFFDTLYYCIPFNSTIFGYDALPYSQVFNSFNHVVGQIPPSLGMNYTFFSYFSPFVTVLFPIIGIYFGERIKYTTSVAKKIVYSVLALYLVISISAYNYQISFSYVLNLVLFIAIVFIFDFERIKKWKR